MHFLGLQSIFAKIKKGVLFKSLIIPQFSYCPLVWMCHGMDLNNKINNIHERASRRASQDKKSIFEILVKHYKSTSIHVKNLQH